jgi:Ca2+-binding protein (EF-Hand superfamily)
VNAVNTLWAFKQCRYSCTFLMLFFFLLQIDKTGDGCIDLSNLKEALDGCGFKLPGWKVRQLIEEYYEKRQIQHRGRLSFDEFEKVLLFASCE